MPVHPVRHLPEPGPWVGDHEHRQPATPGAGPAGRVGEDGHGAGPRRVLAELGPVVMGAGQRRVQVTGPDPARVVGDAGHGQRAPGPAQRILTGRVVPAGKNHAEEFGEPGQRAALGGRWAQIRKHGPRLPLITVR